MTVVVLSGAELHAANVAADAADAAAAVAVAACGSTVTGATGNAAHVVPGTFRKTGAMQNGRPVYSKDGDADTWCYCGPGGRWYVSDTAKKDANKKGGWAATVEGRLAAPQLEQRGNCIRAVPPTSEPRRRVRICGSVRTRSRSRAHVLTLFNILYF